jgi:cell fate (sporulation/competence/biofilm development) regulator YlbF (YheA/YmcA/DUF963 family)
MAEEKFEEIYQKADQINLMIRDNPFYGKYLETMDAILKDETLKEKYMSLVDEGKRMEAEGEENASVTEEPEAPIKDFIQAQKDFGELVRQTLDTIRQNIA